MATLIRIGNSQGIRIPKAIIKQAQLENKELKFKVTDEGLLIQPMNQPREGWKQQFEQVLSTQESDDIDQEWLDISLSSDEDWEW